MSTDYDLVCLECNESLAMVASGSIAYGDKLWRGKEELDELSKFLFKHHNHTLKFLDENYHEALKESKVND